MNDQEVLNAAYGETIKRLYDSLFMELSSSPYSSDAIARTKARIVIARKTRDLMLELLQEPVENRLAKANKAGILNS